MIPVQRFIAAFALGFIITPVWATESDREKPAFDFLWYTQPVAIPSADEGNPAQYKVADGQARDNWAGKALPIGNGRIGGMVFGGAVRERIALNEISLWTGGLNPGGGYNYGPLCDQNDFGSFQPFADLYLDFDLESEDITDYTRSLSLRDAISRVSFKSGETGYKREFFASYPDQVIAIHCSSSEKGKISGKLMLRPNHTCTITAGKEGLTLKGTLKNGMEFEGRVVVLPQGGSLKASGGTTPVEVTYNESQPVLSVRELPSLKLVNADSCTILVSLATDYQMSFKKNWKGTGPGLRNKAILAKAEKKSYGELKKEHIANYQSLFDRVQIFLGKTNPALSSLPTDERIKAYQESARDPELEATLFQYGRYILISSSRPGSLPGNLQGLWNDNVQQAWASDYHSNINLQMNYWGAEPANLPECHQPLIDFFEAMAEPSRIASKRSFKSHTGKEIRGWTVRTSQNPFGGQGWEWNIPGSAWYARHIWDHYAFTLDKEYLRKQAYPLMKEIAQFWEDHLKPLGKGGDGFKSDGKTPSQEIMAELKDVAAGTLVAPNGWSPEHGPREDGVAHDQQLIWDLFTNTALAANILGVDKTWAAEVLKKRDKLAGPKIGKEGNLQEWMIDRIAKTDHRHTSHLYAVYPGSQISIQKTPELAEAAQKSLEWRGTSGDSRRSWTWPWRTGLWARFGDGDRAHEMIEGLIKHNLLDNMLATHPPMQMDGTYGITGGMAEMLVQSHNPGEIVLLPAPTKAWPDGFVKGLKARGNITVDFEWKEGKVTDYTLKSPVQKQVKVIVNGKMIQESTSQL